MDKYYSYLLERYHNYKNVLFTAASIPYLFSDKEVETIMMEELDIDIPCYITVELLDLLCENNIIYEEIKKQSLDLRSDFIVYRAKAILWNKYSFLNSDIWKKWYINANVVYQMLYF